MIALTCNVTSAYFGLHTAKTFTFGISAPNARYIMQWNVFAPKKFGRRRIFEETVHIPPDFMYITQIFAKNQKNRGSCHIVAGGPGSDFVTLRFVSRINQSVKFIMHLNGIPY